MSMSCPCHVITCDLIRPCRKEGRQADRQTGRWSHCIDSDPDSVGMDGYESSIARAERVGNSKQSKKASEG